MASANYTSRAAEFSIENGVVCIKMQTGDVLSCWHMPLLEFRRSAARAAQLLEEHDARGVVVRMAGH